MKKALKFLKLIGSWLATTGQLVLYYVGLAAFKFATLASEHDRTWGEAKVDYRAALSTYKEPQA